MLEKEREEREREREREREIGRGNKKMIKRMQREREHFGRRARE